MKQNSTQTDGGINKFVDHLVAEKGKLVPLLCLVSLMVFMWGRMLFKKDTQAAEATIVSGQLDAEQESKLKISFVELPEIKGRNDVLSRDFFALNDERLGGIREVSGIGVDDGYIKQIVGKLKLQAIGGGDNRQAFINDKLLSVGDKLAVSEAVECEVVRIDENKVVLKYREAEIKLKLAQDVKVAD